MTALHFAAMDGQGECVRLLLAAGANVNAADAQGMTPLHFAAREHKCEVARLLLDAGALVDAEDSFGNTPLFRAVFQSRGRGDMIQLLRAFGADVNRKNKRGVSPRDLAETIANYPVSRWLV